MTARVCAPVYDYALASARAAVQAAPSDTAAIDTYTPLLSAYVVALIERLGRPKVREILHEIVVDAEILK